uniref:Uncharacterized protein n=1 Tax=Cucumis sativus TaxID=3659 RepID=A0A0A0LEX7_CUCSA
MAAMHISPFLPLPSRFCSFTRCFFNFHSTLSISPRLSLLTLRSSSAPPMETSTNVQPSDSVMIDNDNEDNKIKNILACSICHGPLTAAAGSGLPVESTNGYQLECGTCKKSFTGSESHLDLTITGGTDSGESMPAATEIFRTRLVSFLYERGWRPKEIPLPHEFILNRDLLAQLYLKSKH